MGTHHDELTLRLAAYRKARVAFERAAGLYNASFMSVEDLQIALENERICAERLGKVVAKHLKQINKAGVCCE